MTTTTKTRPVTTTAIGQDRTANPTVATPRTRSWRQALKDRRQHHRELAATIAAYPATRSAAAFVLPSPQGATDQAPAVVPSAARQRRAG